MVCGVGGVERGRHAGARDPEDFVGGEFAEDEEDWEEGDEDAVGDGEEEGGFGFGFGV